MRLSARLPLYAALWFAAEVAAFAVIAHAIGFGGAVFLCVLTSFGGVIMLRRLGFSTALRLRRALAARSHEAAGLSGEAMVDGALVGIGSILLIIPGFVSDFFGLALAAPSVRAWLSEKFQNGRMSRGSRGSRSGPTLVELDPQDWSRTEPPGGRLTQAKLGRGKSPS